ncbi:MAG TPA: DUF397 domain-containing protein [Streptosporangiaceae bacterium]|nr:DUF397 domain-containing protein [Streptosporangiaceae bacterium]
MHISSVTHVNENTLAPAWRKSSRSTHAGNCVEVAEFHEHHVAVRDSKNLAGTPIVFTAQDWAIFVANVKNV